MLSQKLKLLNFLHIVPLITELCEKVYCCTRYEDIPSTKDVDLSGDESVPPVKGKVRALTFWSEIAAGKEALKILNSLDLLTHSYYTHEKSWVP